jgi:hypothetical protein
MSSLFFILLIIVLQGEGVERNGQHIHTFIPDDVGNFNASHIIHELRFGPDYSNGLKASRREPTTLEGVKKILTEDNGESEIHYYYYGSYVQLSFQNLK